MGTLHHPGSCPFRRKHIKGLPVGGCYLIEDKDVAYQARNVVYLAAKAYGFQITTRVTADGGLRIWRDA